MDSFRTYGQAVSEALREVLSTSYVLLAASIAAFVFVLAVWLPNLRLLMSVVLSSDVSMALKWQLATGLLGSIWTNFTLLSATLTVVSVLLLGLNTAMVTYYLKRQRRLVSQRTMLTGIGGLITGAFGLGCAACGSFLLTSILVSLGASGLLVLLPLKGAEFGLLGVILLLVTLVLVSKAITQAAACRITPQ